jgi:CRISPR-associated Csx11 family protein
VADLLDLLEKYREAILLGEFGALIHMLGKASSEFLKAYSAEAGPKDTHQDLKHLPKVTPKLETSALRDRFTFTVDGAPATLSGDFADFITKYKGSAPDSHLLKLFNTCHRMTSADEKGVVRHKQSIASMRITTPFGRVVRCVSPSEVDKLREKMDAALAEALEGYLQGSSKIVEFRARAIAILKPALSETLGETREPANDVTLWAQSYGVASLYKSCLATLAVGKDPCPKKNGAWDYDDVRWRLLGIGWNGLGFVQRGRRAADILRRQEILDDLRETLRNLVEVECPLGNLFYQDLNGAFFTFPGIEDEPASGLVKELASRIVEKARKLSDNELWPFFTLSKPRRTLTAIAGEINERDRLAASPCIAPILSIETGKSRNELLVEKGPSLSAPGSREDICPLCRFRSKAVTADTCGTCSERRRGRQDTWRKNQQDETIWIDEIADANGRVALLTLRFDLSRWLSGEWLTTIFSQTFEQWLDSAQMKALLSNPQQGNKIKNIAEPAPNAGTAIRYLEHCLTKPMTADPAFKASLLQTFFEPQEVQINQDTLARHVDNLRGRINDDTSYQLTAEDLARSIFTQNPSPGRLTRTWEATQNFLACLRSAIASDVFKSRPGRLSFQTAAAVPRAQPGETYAIEVPSLNGGSLAVLCLNGTRFLTIDCLDRFTLAKGGQTLKGRDAVDRALRDRRIQSWRRETDGVQIAQEISVANVACGGSYLPFTVLGRSPVFYQVLLPARSVPQVLHKILLLGEDHFGKVRGKLPLHVGLLVANRRFPLYALVEAGQQILGYPDLRRGWLQYSWWESDPTDDFFGSYPTKGPDDHGFPIANLLPVERDKQFWITPGFFDFDFLGATTDRHRLRYEAGAPPTRTAIKHGWLCPRPMPLHRLKQLLGIWKLLSEDLTTTQRHQIDAALGTKLEQWRSQGEEARPVFHNFAKTILQDAFGRAWFESLNSDQRGQLLSAADDGLLMDAMELFQHVLKGGGENE